MLYINNADKRVSSGIEDRIDHFLRCGSERDIFATMDFVMLACKSPVTALFERPPILVYLFVTGESIVR